MEVSVELKGMKELNARLDELSALGQKKLLSRVVRRVAKPIMVEAKWRLHHYRKSGALAAAVGVYARRTRGKEVVAVQIGAQKKHKTALFVHNAYYGRKRKGIFYGHLLEFGHRIATRQRSWRHDPTGRGGGRASSGGSVPVRPWLSPAVQSGKSRMASAFVEELKRGLDAIAKRRGQKSANTDGLIPP